MSLLDHVMMEQSIAERELDSSDELIREKGKARLKGLVEMTRNHTPSRRPDFEPTGYYP